MLKYQVNEGNEVDFDGVMYAGGAVIELNEKDERTLQLISNGYIKEFVEVAESPAPAEEVAPAPAEEVASSDVPADAPAEASAEAPKSDESVEEKKDEEIA